MRYFRPFLIASIMALSAIWYVCARAVPNSEIAAQPDPFWHDLQPRLDALMQQPPLATSKVGVSILDCNTGGQLYDRDGHQLMNPASNLKVLTTIAAMEVLGPAYRFRTSFLYDGTFLDGVISGNVYVRGEGDPELVYETVWKIVKDLQALGVESIAGDLIADDSHFDSKRTIDDWREDSADDATHPYNAMLGALSFNFNTIALMVAPSNNAGDPAIIRFETPTDYLHVANKATTGPARSAMSLKFARDADAQATDLTLEGRIALASSPRRFYRTVPDPPRFALTLLTEMLVKEGVKFKGLLRTGSVPDSAIPLYHHFSRPLDILLKYMNKLSSNFIAEQILKAMSAKLYGAPGTTEGGVRVLNDYLARHNLPWTDAAIYNGSGLSTRTQVSPFQLASLICHAENDFTRRYDFLATLPIAGIDGTLQRRMLGTPAVGHLRAKTGSINGVFGFSGVLHSGDGKTAAFSFIVNELRGSPSRVKEIQDDWANLIIGKPLAPPVIPGPDVATPLPAITEE